LQTIRGNFLGFFEFNLRVIRLAAYIALFLQNALQQAENAHAAHLAVGAKVSTNTNKSSAACPNAALDSEGLT